MTMICNQLQDLLGFNCHPLNSTGTVALIETPFTYQDGEGVPVFVEATGNYLRFFDDGNTLMHFIGRGMTFADKRKAKPIQGAAERNGAQLNEAGEIEVWSPLGSAAQGFAKFISAMLGIVAWETESIGDNHDAIDLIDEVELCLRAWRKDDKLQRDPELFGISGHKYTFHFWLDGKAILAIQPNAHAVSAAIRKTLDVISNPREAGKFSVQVVLDDRRKPEDARDEAKVINAVAEVIMMTKLERLAGIGTA